jgi:hypothetical protein
VTHAGGEDALAGALIELRETTATISAAAAAGELTALDDLLHRRERAIDRLAHALDGARGPTAVEARTLAAREAGLAAREAQTAIASLRRVALAAKAALAEETRVAGAARRYAVPPDAAGSLDQSA